MKKIVLIVNGIILLFISNLVAQNYIAIGDSLFQHRNDVFDAQTILADSTIINEMIDIYNLALNSADKKERETAVWKLLQAYYFKGNFTTSEKDGKRKLFEKGIAIGEQYHNQYANSVEINCWMAILWGYWAENNGLIASARKGVANKVKFYAEKTIELDDTYFDGAGYRSLGALHLKVPKIPLLLSWPSKDKALELLAKAHNNYPENLFNQYYYAQALVHFKKYEQARNLLNRTITQEQVIHGLAADAFIKKEAKELLEKIGD